MGNRKKGRASDSVKKKKKNTQVNGIESDRSPRGLGIDEGRADVTYGALKRRKGEKGRGRRREAEIIFLQWPPPKRHHPRI